MKTKIGLLDTTFLKVVFTLLSIFLIGISCKKEGSAVSTPHTGSLSIFTKQVPTSQTFNDNTDGIELGVKFQTTVDGNATGIRFYKTSGNIGTHTAQLYATDGTLLASNAFINETDSGWQSVLFDTAVTLAANTTYVAAYHSSLGNYSVTPLGLRSPITNLPLSALADGSDGINGLFKFTKTPVLPDSSYLSSNYWVDIIFVPADRRLY